MPKIFEVQKYPSTFYGIGDTLNIFDDSYTPIEITDVWYKIPALTNIQGEDWVIVNTGYVQLSSQPLTDFDIEICETDGSSLQSLSMVIGTAGDVSTKPNETQIVWIDKQGFKGCYFINSKWLGKLLHIKRGKYITTTVSSLRLNEISGGYDMKPNTPNLTNRIINGKPVYSVYFEKGTLVSDIAVFLLDVDFAVSGFKEKVLSSGVSYYDVVNSGANFDLYLFNIFNSSINTSIASDSLVAGIEILYTLKGLPPTQAFYIDTINAVDGGSRLFTYTGCKTFKGELKDFINNYNLHNKLGKIKITMSDSTDPDNPTFNKTAEIDLCTFLNNYDGGLAAIFNFACILNSGNRVWAARSEEQYKNSISVEVNGENWYGRQNTTKLIIEVYEYKTE